jgi:hypothetical protein
MESSPTLRALCFNSNGLSLVPDKRLLEEFSRYLLACSRPPLPEPPPEPDPAATPQTLLALLDVSKRPESGADAERHEYGYTIIHHKVLS